MDCDLHCWLVTLHVWLVCPNTKMSHCIHVVFLESNFLPPNITNNLCMKRIENYGILIESYYLYGFWMYKLKDNRLALLNMDNPDIALKFEFE